MPQLTAYRQQALAVAGKLAVAAARPRDLRAVAPDAARILQANVYGWFERVERGVYTLTDSGRTALAWWGERTATGHPEPVPDDEAGKAA